MHTRAPCLRPLCRRDEGASATHHSLAASVIRDKRRRQCDPRALAGLDLVGVRRVGVEAADSIGLGHARGPGQIAQHVARGRRRDHVA